MFSESEISRFWTGHCFFSFNARVVEYAFASFNGWKNCAGFYVLVTARESSLGKVMFSLASVILSTDGVGRYIYHPPLLRSSGDHKRAVRILLECCLGFLLQHSRTNGLNVYIFYFSFLK